MGLRQAALELERTCEAELAGVARANRPSARNLLHYLTLRQHDLRGVQQALAQRGLSSLGRAEAHVLATIDAVLARLGVSVAVHEGAPTFASSRRLLHRHAAEALGPVPARDPGRLMVTLPSNAASEPSVVAGLVTAGMDLARVNCAHDDAPIWLAMVDRVRAEAARAGREVRVAFDLAGPKLRTGPLPPGPRVVRVRPWRAADGSVQRPAHARFTTSEYLPSPGFDGVEVPTVGDLLREAMVGDEIVLRDTRGRRREFVVTEVHPTFTDATCDRTSYLGQGLRLERLRGGRFAGDGKIGELPAADSFIWLARGDCLWLERGRAEGRPARYDADGTVLDPAVIGCELDSVFDAVDIGDRVLIDDGAIECVVDRVEPGRFEVVVVRPERAKLKAEKGINLPDTAFPARALTDEDRAALAVIAPVADLVSLSFVRSVDDFLDLRHALDDLGCPDVAVGLKIEHASAFEALPRLLLAALQRPPVAVMLARGDLAIEVGFERLAEVQEEVLWLCEAAHIPVIWATQVAESMAKDGVPTRAEVTDAAWASRAECVMLNKGPHILDAIHFLNDVVGRMHEHQDKRTTLLRRLSVSEALGAAPPRNDPP